MQKEKKSLTSLNDTCKYYLDAVIHFLKKNYYYRIWKHLTVPMLVNLHQDILCKFIFVEVTAFSFLGT